MHTKISTDYKGMTQEAVNVELHNNVIKPINPTRNAVIIDFIETDGVDGEKTVKTIITIECKDESLYEEMKIYAQYMASRMHR